MGRIRFVTTTLSSREPRRLADFYGSLLGWRRTTDEPGWVVLAGDDSPHRLGFHVDDHHQPPVWPSRPGEPTMQVHLELAVDDLPAAVERALLLGAVEADVQPLDGVRVMVDPDGHPFCLFLWEGMPPDA